MLYYYKLYKAPQYWATNFRNICK